MRYPETKREASPCPAPGKSPQAMATESEPRVADSNRAIPQEGLELPAAGDEHTSSNGAKHRDAPCSTEESADGPISTGKSPCWNGSSERLRLIHERESINKHACLAHHLIVARAAQKNPTELDPSELGLRALVFGSGLLLCGIVWARCGNAAGATSTLGTVLFLTQVGGFRPCARLHEVSGLPGWAKRMVECRSVEVLELEIGRLETELERIPGARRYPDAYLDRCEERLAEINRLDPKLAAAKWERLDE